MARKGSGPSRPPVLEGRARDRSGTETSQTSGGKSGASDAIDTRLAKAEAAARQDKGVPYTGDAGAAATVQSPSAPDPEPTPPQSSSERDRDTAAETSTPPHSAAPSPPLRPDSRAAPARGGLVLAGALGALGGLVLAYGLALAGLWPGLGTGDLDSRIAALEAVDPAPAPDGASETLDALETRIAALESGTSQDDDSAEIQAAQETAAAARMTAETVSENLERLENRIAAMAEAGDSGDAGAALAARLDEMEAALADAGTGRAAVEERVGALEAALAEQPALADMQADRDRLAQWPQALAALRGALSNGTPFEAELGQVRTLAPEIAVPEALSAAAGEGLMRDQALIEGFSARIPAMLQAAPADPDASWSESLLGQAAAVLALRPAGDVEGDGPQAHLARAEAALEAGDYAEAAGAMAQLPEPMLAAAGTVPGQIAAKAGAETYLAEAESLTPAAGPAQAEGTPE